MGWQQCFVARSLSRFVESKREREREREEEGESERDREKEYKRERSITTLISSSGRIG